ncbi:ABC transporter ATP-binding protein [Flavobacterium sp. xlx-214]|uniref:ABC transporter ATP-binding protein n=1 Tax=unclassified Flavobacterium TaxID=196869 RepID=UPI0013D8B8A9|nr:MULTISPECIES: ABC transporter ATP-binding protein [unclassified Flavobacterium]MBA5791653.1 ABC transporter ATP-binding protein [Flavobacterium sp. xlx-221]QMI82896.1 ABC transporter ATP-binding protein [Flavobacterium sp. xlx-214]
MNVFKAENVTIGYKEKTLFSHLNFELRTGVLTSLLGSNGIGKSTLLKTISRLIDLKEGVLSIDNQPINNLSTVDFSHWVSMVLTTKDTNKDLTVYELVKLGRQPYTNWLDQLSQEDELLIEQTLLDCEILDLKDRKIAQLSDGQVQRTFIARAVVQDTPFIFLDEPSTHLDLYHKVHLFKLLKKLCVQKNKCILFSTHDLDLALQLSDEIMLLKGKTFYHNSTTQLINQGVFDRFFDTDEILFDKERRQFIIL